MNANYKIKDTIPEFYSKILTAGLNKLAEDAYPSIEIVIPIHYLCDHYKLGGREQVRKKVKEMFYFMDAVCVVNDSEEFSAVLHVKYEINDDALRIMYNELMINRLIELSK